MSWLDASGVATIDKREANPGNEGDEDGQLEEVRAAKEST